MPSASSKSKMYSESDVGEKPAAEDGCCAVSFLKYVLYIFNTMFWISGGVVLGVGLWTLLDKHHYVTLLSSSTYPAATYILIGAGALVMLVGFIGCCGAWREKRGYLVTYSMCLWVIFLLQAIGGVLATLYGKDQLQRELQNDFNNTILKFYKFNAEKTAAVDRLQREFSCCGAASFFDWRASQWLRNSDFNGSAPNLTPDSCCKTFRPGCARRDHPSNIYYTGCIPRLELYLREHLIILGAVGLGICCLQIFGMIFSCCLVLRLKKKDADMDSM